MARRGGGRLYWLGAVVVLALIAQFGRNSDSRPTANYVPKPPVHSSSSTNWSPPTIVAPKPVAFSPSASVEVPAPAPAGLEVSATHSVTATRLNIRDLPTANGAILGSLVRGTGVTVVAIDAEWALIELTDGRLGWVSGRYLLEVSSGSSATTASVSAPAAPMPLPPSSPGERLRAAYIGTCDCPYDIKRNGSSCGATSAWSRPGGRSPQCYSSDATIGAGSLTSERTLLPEKGASSCAENGTCYGDISIATGKPKTVRVKGYYRKDGTYVRGHYRSK